MQKLLSCLALVAFVACNADRATGPTDPAELAVSPNGQAEIGAVYTQTNAASGNEVLAFARGAQGVLTPIASYPTGGNGTGVGLGSQGSVILNHSGNRLFVVNAGSNSISAFAVRKDGTLELLGVVASGGVKPISLTTRGDQLFVLNGGGTGNITGFENALAGALVPIAGSTRPLSTGASDPAQVDYDPRGDFLVVAEKATNVLGVYTFQSGGVTSGPVAMPSAGLTPFGFAFTNNRRLIVSEAFGGAPDASAVSSYRLAKGGALQVISPSVPTTETAACWIVITKSGRFTYTTNTGSGTITGYSILSDGSLQILDADGRTGITGPGSTPIDMALSRDSRFLYSTNTGNGTISVFLIGADGSLEELPFLTGLPVGIVGLAAR
jgi:6-phosphogluconolactonase (cycloisomerase 2 family)